MVNKDTAYKKISELVERFTDQYDSYKKSDYNETQTRRDFIDPFFKALGWDIDNEQGYAESYREVIHEDRVKVGGATKAPDYSFRLVGGKRLFFVEAKKPSLSVKEEIPSAYQIRRYGWSAKLPVSIITDFEEFSVYDCTKKPKPTDKASTARITYIAFRDYLKEFDFIWETFSKERVLKGSFDKFVQSDTYKKGTATVDKDFLQSLDRWRTYLATSIALNNQKLDEDEINFAVQQTIDRIIFLRIAEDRSVEPYGNLKDAIKQGDFYKNLFEQFCRADEKYNSGLFDFNKDQISKHLEIDNKVMKTIINELYYPESPYEFSVLSVEILGSAYEQFLGKVIRITPAYHAKIEEKPEVRKAGGVYYTPQYIVEYIVQNTVGKLISGMSPKEISNIKIVDPACGSGSFLLGAYQYLLDYHKNYYYRLLKQTAKGKQQDNSTLPQRGTRGELLTPEGNLTTNEKKRILLNNIFGVDIDVNAVEVTKLSLLLKCMEGETEASINHQLKMFNERILPDLENNIKSGNSLIDTDFYASQLDFGDGKIKPFNWQREFPEVFKDKREDINIKEELKTIAQQAKTHAKKVLEYSSELVEKLELLNEPKANYQRIIRGGFDVVIGNPPYIQLAMFDWFDDEQKKYLLNKYCSSMGRMNTFGFFIEKGINLLTANGKLGFIIPNTILTQEYYQELRNLILKTTHIDNIVSYEKLVFADAVVETTTLILTNYSSKAKTKIMFCDKDLIYSEKLVSQETFKLTHKNQFSVSYNEADAQIKSRIDKNCILTFNDIGEINQAIALKSDRAAYIFDKKINTNYKPVLDGREINRYQTNWAGKYLKYDINAIHSCKREDIFLSKEKIYFRRVSASLIATLDDKQFYALNTLVAINKKEEAEYDIKFILAVFNSKLINYYYNKFLKSTKKVFSEIQARQIGQLPFPTIDLNGKEVKANHDEIVQLVDQLLKLNIEKTKTKLQTKINQLQSKIDYCENRINEIVYQLYGLTEDEIKIVEKS